MDLHGIIRPYMARMPAAIVPVCAGARPTTTLASKVASKNLAIWSINSSNDKVVPIQWGKDWITWIDQYNPANASKTKITVWTTESHNDTWWRAFDPKTKVDGYSLYEWMLLYKRTSTGTVTPTPVPTPTPTPTTGNKAPVANGGPDRIHDLSANTTRAFLNGSLSKDPDGWLIKYTWTKVSGPATSITVKKFNPSLCK